MALSTLRKYKLITDKDLMQSVKNLQAVVADGDFENYTTIAEPIFYALNLAKDMVDVNDAKRLFNEYKQTSDMGVYADKFSTENLGQLISDSI